MQARLARAMVKSLQTMRPALLTYFWTSSEQMTQMKQALVRLAMARVMSVLAMPEGLYKHTKCSG